MGFPFYFNFGENSARSNIYSVLHQSTRFTQLPARLGLTSLTVNRYNSFYTYTARPVQEEGKGEGWGGGKGRGEEEEMGGVRRRRKWEG